MTGSTLNPQWVSLSDALSQLLSDAIPVTETEERPLTEALGGLLANDIKATIDVPGEDNSAVDGYAFNHSDSASHPVILPISQRIAAGQAGSSLQANTAARIFTGAPIPPGANTVVMQEQTERKDDRVQLLKMPEPGANIRPRGQDIKAGECILQQGHRCRPQDLGLLASLGIAKVRCRRQLRIALLSTGDEIIEPGQPLQPGQLYNSNRYLLMGLLKSLDVQLLDMGRVKDDPKATQKALVEAAEQADLVISTGGVSVGEEDHIKQAVAELGELKLWKLAIKPGKPLAYGHIGEVPFLGLPGNPAAVLVTFCLIAKPYILALQGARKQAPLSVQAKANFSKPAGNRDEFLRARLTEHNGETWIEPHPNQSSGMLSSASWADGLALAPSGQRVDPGDRLAFLPFSGLLS